MKVKHIKTGTIYKQAVYKAGHRNAICKTQAGNEVIVRANKLVIIKSIDK